MSTDAQGKAYMLNRGAPENKSIYKETHKPGTPWAETLANGIISFDSIRDYFKGQKL